MVLKECEEYQSLIVVSVESRLRASACIHGPVGIYQEHTLDKMRDRWRAVIGAAASEWVAMRSEFGAEGYPHRLRPRRQGERLHGPSSCFGSHGVEPSLFHSHLPRRRAFNAFEALKGALQIFRGVGEVVGAGCHRAFQDPLRLRLRNECLQARMNRSQADDEIFLDRGAHRVVITRSINAYHQRARNGTKVYSRTFLSCRLKDYV